MSRTARIILSAIVMLLGCVGLCCGVYSGVLFPLVFDSEVARVGGLSPSSYFAVEDGAPGREVLIEGVISGRNRASAEGFVVYTRYRREAGPGGDVVWREVERVRPPLLLELPDGAVRVRGDYTVSGTEERFEAGDVRVVGLRAGAAAFAVGALVAGQEGIEVEAALLGVGTRETFLESNREAATVLRVLGWALLGCGAVVVCAGLLPLILALRRRGP